MASAAVFRFADRPDSTAFGFRLPRLWVSSCTARVQLKALSGSGNEGSPRPSAMARISILAALLCTGASSSQAGLADKLGRPETARDAG